MAWRKFKFLLVFLLFIALSTSGAVCSSGGTDQAKMQFRNIDLQFWGVFDEAYFYNEITANYGLMHPNINVSYRKFRFDEYEAELLNALAEDRGPDIFMVHNTGVGKYLPKMEPCPDKLTLAYKVTTGTIKKETYIELRTINGIRVNDIITNFVDQVQVDAIRVSFDPTKEQIPPPAVYAAPMALDNLVMFYNKDILNNAGIPLPARSWSEFQDHVKKIVRLDSQGNIILAGSAIGTSENVERSIDILSLLMMQNGTEMGDSVAIKFHEKPLELKERVFPPGVEALRFYTDFSSPIKEVYTWDDSMPNSLESFISGKVGYFFGYSYHLPIIESKAPKLNFAVAKVPQISGSRERNYANYYLLAVSKKSDAVTEAWDFIKFATLNRDMVKGYLSQSNKPTALRDLIAGQTEDLDMKPFAEQVLTAQSWYLGYDPLVMEDALKELIENTNRGDVRITEILSHAASIVQQTMKQKFLY